MIRRRSQWPKATWSPMVLPPYNFGARVEADLPWVHGEEVWIWNSWQTSFLLPNSQSQVQYFWKQGGNQIIIWVMFCLLSIFHAQLLALWGQEPCLFDSMQYLHFPAYRKSSFLGGWMTEGRNTCLVLETSTEIRIRSRKQKPLEGLWIHFTIFHCADSVKQS